MENTAIFTVFGKNLIANVGKETDVVKQKAIAANHFQQYLQKNLGVPNREAYAIMCLAFGYRHSCGELPQDIPYNKIYIIVMALPDNIKV